jgi:monoamine oxidase
VRVETAAANGGLTRTFESRALVVALPLGVLQASIGELGAVTFEPALADKQAAAANLVAGPVVKVLLRFADAFWETEKSATLSKAGSLRDTAFFHAHGLAVPTWWTMLPLRLPLLTGWAGGPDAAALSGRDDAYVLDRALDSLATILGISRRRIESGLQQTIVNDWQSDPFSRGAYSYVPVGGAGARKKLARPVADTLFFAGEATNYESQPGTVAGAIAAGYRAAREVERALK